MGVGAVSGNCLPVLGLGLDDKRLDVGVIVAVLLAIFPALGSHPPVWGYEPTTPDLRALVLA